MVSRIDESNTFDRRVRSTNDVNWVVLFGLLRLGRSKVWVGDPGTGEHTVSKDPDVVAIVPLAMITHRAVNHRVSGDVVVFVRVDRKADTDVMDARHEVERFPISFTRCDLTGTDCLDVWIVGPWTVLNYRIGKDGQGMDGRPPITLPRILIIHLTVDVYGNQAGLFDDHVGVAVTKNA